ncbi:hypothetical protein [Phaeodactylibacter luteus]|uniref:Uncharacterized protein n=1 Tax=Phaeodactylibacter luteus TaxID=1564516 RepID=A0A5C6RL99_9BACT|nr:hypothetical protein [Phaeodactylibacter luteus]TXB62689.1 hypothetical protein FRY97_12625 [Phaeodactylibacter luteus]
MSGIREVLGFAFWVDNGKPAPIQALLNGHAGYSKERTAIMHDLEEERKSAKSKNGRKKLGGTAPNP